MKNGIPRLDLKIYLKSPAFIILHKLSESESDYIYM